MKKIKFIGLFLCFLTISNVYAAEHQVKMLSSNAGF